MPLKDFIESTLHDTPVQDPEVQEWFSTKLRLCAEKTVDAVNPAIRLHQEIRATEPGDVVSTDFHERSRAWLGTPAPDTDKSEPMCKKKGHLWMYPTRDSHGCVNCGAPHPSYADTPDTNESLEERNNGFAAETPTKHSKK